MSIGSMFNGARRCTKQLRRISFLRFANPLFVDQIPGLILVIAGADLNELAELTTAEAHRIGWLKDVENAFKNFQKPIIAAVRGLAVSNFERVQYVTLYLDPLTT